MVNFIVIVLVALGACGTVLLKIGAGRVAYDEGWFSLFRSSLFNLPLVVGMVLQLIPLVSWVVLLKFMPLTKLQPMIALTYVVTPVLAVIFLGEHVGLLRGCGIALIVVGVVLVAAS